jgi:formamidopyrimidine-DNA glycosylase
MPELPEVETVRRGLEPALAGTRLARVEARRPDLRFALPENFARRLTGARIERLERRGKYILAPLDTGETLIIHLGMTGRFEIEGGSRPDVSATARPANPRHAHIVFHTEAGGRVTYFDARRFGSMDLVSSDRLGEYPPLRAMGPEPFDGVFDRRHLSGAFAGRRQGAKTLLLDQSIVAGLGNIYVCEVLFRAAVSPLRAASTIGRAGLDRIVSSVREVLGEAIAAGGSTLRDYAGADGALGYFQHSFDVYGRAGEPCRRPGCAGVISRIVQAGRSTFHCPRCQK